MRPNRKLPRKTDYDYTSSGAYFVTVCTYDSALVFGDVVDKQMQLTDVGAVAQDCWVSVPEHFDHATADCFIVMPNHVHAIIVLNNQDDVDVGKRHASSLPNQPEQPKHGIYKDGKYIPRGVETGSLGAVVGSYKSAVTKIVNRTVDDPPSRLWQTGYHDHIIRDEKSFYTIRNYILTNPERWDDDRFNL